MTKRKMTRREFMEDAGSAAATCALMPLHSSIPFGNNSGAQDSGGQRTPLRDRAARKGLLYGSSAQRKEFEADPRLEATFAAQCNILVPELDLKWDHLRPTPDSYNFAPADYLLNFSQQHQIQFRGHCLVWQRALPKWFAGYVTPQNAQQIMLDHIAKVAGHFSGKVHSWDVVNEVILPSDKRGDGLSNSPWLQNIGPEYIEIAFRAARAADPNALLVWNEDFRNDDSPTAEANRTFFLQHLKEKLSRGVPIQAIGIQSHLAGDQPNIACASHKHFLKQVGDLGLKILVTEMDVHDQKLPADVQARDQAVAAVYYNYLSGILAEKAVIAILTWGLCNKYTWLNSRHARADGLPIRPLPYDENMNPTPVWDAIARAIDDAPLR